MNGQDEEKRDLVSIAEFARRMGVARTTVIYAIKRGRITVLEINGVKKIDSDQARAQWFAGIDGKASAKAQKLKEKLAAKKNGGQKEAAPVVKKIKYEGPPKFDSEGQMTTAEAERREKVYKAQLSELKYLEQAGRLIEVEKVQKIAFETGRKVRDAVMTVPAKMAHELAAETSPHKVEVMLSKALAKCLDHLTGVKFEKG